MKTTILPDKRAIFLTLLAKQCPVYVTVDARFGDVVVPKEHAHSGLVLQYGYSLPRPIRCFEATPLEIRGVLGFNTCGDFACIVPWWRVYNIRGDTDQFIWPDCAPVDLAKEPDNDNAPTRKLRLVK